MTYAKKRDSDHAIIRDGLRKCGYRVFDCASAGDGMPDLLVMGRDGIITLVEVKSPRGRLTASEKKLHDLFNGSENLMIVRSLEDALMKLERIEQWLRNY